MKPFGWMVALSLLLAPSLSGAQPHSSEQDPVWAREIAYWKAVDTVDLGAYRSLWCNDFLGWPFSSHNPARKANIADWINKHTTRGERLKSYSLERLTEQVSGNMATTTYRVYATWANKAGREQSETARILHTWRRDDDGTWRIFSGMSAPEESH